MQFGSTGDKDIEPRSCRFLLDKSQEKGDGRVHKQRNPVVRGKMLSYPICSCMPIPVNVFPLPSEIKAIITGTGAEKHLTRLYMLLLKPCLCDKAMSVHKHIFNNIFWENQGRFPIFLQLEGVVCI